MPFTIRPYRRVPLPCSVAYDAGPSLTLSQPFFLGFWLLVMFLVLSSGHVYAEWVLVSGDDAAGLAVYVDPATIRRNGNLAKMWQLYDYKTVQTVAGDSLLSMKRFNEYDCKKSAHACLDIRGSRATWETVKWCTVRLNSNRGNRLHHVASIDLSGKRRAVRNNHAGRVGQAGRARGTNQGERESKSVHVAPFTCVTHHPCGAIQLACLCHESPAPSLPLRPLYYSGSVGRSCASLGRSADGCG